MNNTPTYSEFLHCIYDEAEPRGQIGRGTHYSIFRTATWFDEAGKMRLGASMQDLAVIWDEDHDERVIGVVERMHMAGLLFPVLFVGERKGSFTVVLSEDFGRSMNEADRRDYEKRVSAIAAAVPMDGGPDYWSAEFGVFEARPRLFTAAERGTYQGTLIQDDLVKTDTYLHNINNLWSLGHKPYDFPTSVTLETTKLSATPRLNFEAETASP